MTAQLGPPLIGLFAPRPPLRFLPAADAAPEKRVTPRVTGLASYVSLLKDHDLGYTPTESWLEARERRRIEKKMKNDQGLEEGLKQCTYYCSAFLHGYENDIDDAVNPNEDTQVRGDPYKTLFVSRLAYDATERDLEELFTKYGPLERVCHSLPVFLLLC